MKFSLPIYQSSGQPYKSADDLLNRLASETAGTYLVGKSNFWHGGIHITDKTAPHCVKNDMVRCMADGTVVAYRINADYLQSACMGESLKYSTGFVLVRHDYKSAENSEEGPNKGKRNELTFYSLYMHVAPFSEYGGGTAKPVYKITADNLRARTEASLSGAEIGFLKTGAEIEVQETREVVNGNQKYLFAHATLKSGAIRNGNAAVDQGKNPFWVAIEQTAPAAKKFAVAQTQKVPELPFYLQGKCIAKTKGEINARINDSGTEDSIHGKLPAGAELTFDRSHEKTITINGTRYRFAPCTIQRCSAPDWERWPSPLWVSVEERFVDITGMRPDHLDEVVACNISVKAGDKLARMGLYESTESLVGGKNSKHLVHVEMFSFDPGLESFLKNSAGLTRGGKFLRLEKGHKLHKKTGIAEAVEFVEGDKALSRVAVVPLSGLKKHKDKAGKQWLEVDISDKTGHLKGFVEEERANLVSQHDWMNLGFQTVRALEAFDGHLARTGIHPFYKELYQKIADEPAPEDRDKIRAALISKDNCAVWSKIIARHPSEWKHPSGHGTWSVLDKLLKSAPELLDHEKERIDKCVWWDDVAGKVPGFDQRGVVWHFHPVGVVSAFVNSSITWATTPFADLLASVESRGDYSAYNRTKGGLKAFFKTNLPTMTVSEIQAKQSKDCREMFAVGKYQIIPATLNAAIKHLSLGGDELFSAEIQDRIFDEYLIRVKRPEIIAYLEGDGDVEDAIYGWAKEFASAGVRAGRKISGGRKAEGGESFYAGDGLNKAHLNPDQMVEVLRISKMMRGY